MTLEDYYTQLATDLGTEVTTATTALEAAQSTVDAKKTDLDTAIGAYEAALAALDEARTRAGAAGASAAEIHAAETDVSTHTTSSRGLAATVAQERAALAAAEADRDQAQTRLTRWTAEKQRAEREWAAYSTRITEQKLWIEQLDEAPLSTLKADVETTLAGADTAAGETPETPAQIYRAAETRVEGDLPAALRTRATDRITTALTLIDLEAETGASATTVVRTADDTATGPETVSSVAIAAYDAAEEALRSRVLAGTSEFSDAVSKLESVLSLTALSDADRAKVEDAALATAAEDALDHEKARDEKLVALTEKKRDYALEALAAIVTDVDAAPPDDADVVSATNELQTAQTTYDAERPHLDAWEIVVPDHVWTGLTTFVLAKTELERLRDADVDQLEQNLTDAEAAVVEALTTAAKARRTRSTLTEDASRLDALSAASLALKDATVFSYARGDHE